MKHYFSLLSNRRLLTFFASVIIAGWLAACQPESSGFNLQQTTPYFVPPTQEITGMDETLQAQANPDGGSAALLDNQPTVTVQCRDSLTFLKDVTIPDGTSVSPDSTLDKRWEVENSGNCNWVKDYRIRLIAGPELGAQKEQALYPARSGSRAVVRIVFKAPLEPGTYRSAWQAFNPQGEPFGDPFFIEIVVEAP